MVNKKSSITVTKHTSKYPNKFLSSNKQTAFFSTNNALTLADTTVDIKDHTQTKAMNIEDVDNNVQNFILNTQKYGKSIPKAKIIEVQEHEGQLNIEEFGGSKNHLRKIEDIQINTTPLNIEKKKNDLEKQELRKMFFEHGLEEKYPNFNEYNNAKLKNILNKELNKSVNTLPDSTSPAINLKPMIKTPTAKPSTRIDSGATTYQDINDESITYHFYTDPKTGVIYYQESLRNDIDPINIPISFVKTRLGWGDDVNIQPAPDWL